MLSRALQRQREMAAVDDETGWAVARRRSVILSGKKDGKPFVREDFTDSLNEILTCLKDHVAAFGPLARNSEWCLTLKTDAAKDIVLCAGTLSVRGCIFYVRSADKMQFSARVLWAPSYIPDAAIVNVLEKTCEVQSIVSEKSTAKGFEGIPTGNRRLVLTGLKDDIPHTFNIINPHTNEKFEILVLIPGRSPLCFRCKETGHFRSECFTPQCRACGVFGHTYESCAVANSYSGKLRGPAKPQNSSTAEASIDDDTQYAYRDGRVEPVAKGGSGQRFVAGSSSTGDPDTPSVVTAGGSGHAAESAGCSSRPGAEVEPLDPPARSAVAHVARDDATPAEAGKSLQPVQAQATDLTMSVPKVISTRDAAGAESVSSSAPESEVFDMTTDSGDDESTRATVASRSNSISTRDATAAESGSASAPESEVVDMTTDSGDEVGSWATVASRKRKLNVGGRVAPPSLTSPPIGRLQIVEDSPCKKLAPRKMCLSDSGSDSISD